MNVRELIEKLSTLDQTLPVVFDNQDDDTLYVIGEVDVEERRKLHNEVTGHTLPLPFPEVAVVVLTAINTF